MNIINFVSHCGNKPCRARFVRNLILTSDSHILPMTVSRNRSRLITSLHNGHGQYLYHP